MGPSQDAQEIGQRVEQVLAEIGALGDAGMQDKVEELVSTLVEFYGSALERIMGLVHESGNEQLLGQLGDDTLVGSLLVVHDLHPLSTEQRVTVALEKVRPYLGSHAGDVELLGVADDVVKLRLAGSCNGCPSSTVTVKLAIEKAIQDAAPEIVDIQVEGVVAEQPPTEFGPGGRPLLPVTTLNGPPEPRRPVATESDWVEVTEAQQAARGSLTKLRFGSMAMVLCNVAGNLYAYRDRCPACGSGLAAGSLTDKVLTCANCANRYDVTLAGRAMSDNNSHLDPLPLLTDQGRVRVALPVEVHA
ncbi:MAG TPA: NifU family protein [Pseudonocardiaceae bacterium]|jgi:Fe-S cluster biogenesis protein NfuA/nitrite reductase/ring-hydroxylating ferredoxin subunit|nr:NifU family protein [Pseudonocardiaceae bacterium]